MRAMYFQCNFMEKGCVGLFLGARLCLMTLACWCTTSWLHSSAHFHTWLTLSPSVWVAGLLKAPRTSSTGTLVDLLQRSCCSCTTTEQTFGRRFCLRVSILSCWNLGGLVCQLPAKLFSGQKSLVPLRLCFNRMSSKVKQLFLWPLSTLCQLYCSHPLTPMSTRFCCSYQNEAPCVIVFLYRHWREHTQKCCRARTLLT